MKKILVAVPELSYTGSVFSAKRICCVLMKNGYVVRVWSHQEGPFEREFIKIGIRPRLIPSNNVYDNESLEKELEEYDLLIANTISTYAIADVAKNIIPTIWYIREAQNLPGWFFSRDIGKYFALMRAEKIYAVSQYAADFISENYHLDVCVLHNCVEDETVGCRKIKKTNNYNYKIKFLALGTLEPRKAFDIFIKAYMGLTECEKAQCEVHFAGRLLGFLKDYYTPLLKCANSEDGVFYHGEIQERKRLLQLISDSDVIVVPSMDESCSLVALEAVMMSKPLIISENVGAKYVVNSNNGWIFETGNIEELKEIYREVLRKRDCLEAMGACSREMYLKTSTYEIYEKNILKMVSEHFVQDKVQYRLMHRARKEWEARQRIEEVFEEMPELFGKKIVIYAAGKTGKDFFRWCQCKGHEVVAWMDKNWEHCSDVRYETSLAVESPEKMREMEFDFVCIAVKKKKLAGEIQDELIRSGITKSKILWIQYRLFQPEGRIT